MSWLDPTLSLESEAALYVDLGQIESADPEQLRQHTRRLVHDWYTHRQLIDCAFRRVSSLEVQLSLATSTPGLPPPNDDHIRWARELQQEQLGAQPVGEPLGPGLIGPRLLLGFAKVLQSLALHLLHLAQSQAQQRGNLFRTKGLAIKPPTQGDHLAIDR